MRDVTVCVHNPSSLTAFLLTRPMRDVTLIFQEFKIIGMFLLTRPMRDVTQELRQIHRNNMVSTHTPHAGRDSQWHVYACEWTGFYSHAPCGT